jgi:hypothetical protein
MSVIFKFKGHTCQSFSSFEVIVCFKCPATPALLKHVHTQGRVEMYMADTHGIESHVPEKDTGIYLNFYQMEIISNHT